MRKGRYKKNLLLETECPAFAEQFYPLARKLQENLDSGQIQAPEFVASYFLSAFQLLKPKNWKGSRLQYGEPRNSLDSFSIYSLRGIPISANRTLISWATGKYQLKLYFDIPSTETVLQMQSQGIRCVTCLLDKKELSQYVMNERDPISFTLHDLIHADYFLYHPFQRQVQIGFSRWMLELWSQSKLQIKMLQDSKLAAAFEYACADMNSHGAHLVKYLKAIFCQALCESLLLELAQSSSVSIAFQQALRALNTPAEKIEHLETLQNELFLKGATDTENQEDHSVTFGELSPA